MPIGVKTFNSSRLSQIREARGLTSGSLAELVDVVPSTISQYENGTQNPRQETLDKLTKVLNVPSSFLVSEKPDYGVEKLYYRSMSSATKSARTKVERRYELMLEVSDYLLEYLDLPELNLPDLGMPTDFRKIDSLMIESAAEQVRQYWLLGRSPIANLVKTLESNGIVVWRTTTEAETLDAFSEYRLPHPMIVLSSDRSNYFRSRFDAAHELAHLILHRNVTEKVIRRSSEYKVIENQAHHFASAFLLPAKEFSDELWDISIDAFRSLKPTWNCSIAMMIMRSKQLNLVDENQGKRLWINLSRRGWRKQEPLDDLVEPELPELMLKSFNLLLNEGIKTKEQIQTDLMLSTSDVERFVGFENGYLSGAIDMAEPTVKKTTGNVVSFRRS